MQSGRRRQGGYNDWAADLRVGLDLRARNTTIKYGSLIALLTLDTRQSETPSRFHPPAGQGDRLSSLVI